MASLARIRVRDPLRISHEEIIEGLRDIICHPNELVVRGRQMHALHREVTNHPRNITQTEQKRRRGISGEVC
jgi:hypothetical protein